MPFKRSSQVSYSPDDFIISHLQGIFALFINNKSAKNALDPYLKSANFIFKNVPTVATTKKTKSVIVHTSQRVGALVVAHEPHKLDVGEVRFFHPR